MGAFAFLKSVYFRAFAVNVKTIALGKFLYQSGHTIWWSDAPMVVFTFLEEYDFSGKTIVPFTSYGTSGWGNSLASIQRSVGNNVTIVEGFAVQEENMQNLSARVTAWFQEIGLA